MKPLSPKTYNLSSNQGFSLMEVLITLSIFIFVMSIALGVGLDTFARTNINQERDQLVFLLSKARARSLNNINQAEHGVKIVGDNIVLYEDGGGEELTGYNDNYNISIDGDGQIQFEQLTGRNVNGATPVNEKISITGNGGTEEITINSEGAIIW